MDKKNTLKIRGLEVEVGGVKVLNGVDLDIRSGEIAVIMGPNGSGKSTLCYSLFGHPAYVVKGGTIEFNGSSLLEVSTEERARAGLFLGFQYPVEVEGLNFGSFLRTAVNEVGLVGGSGAAGSGADVGSGAGVGLYLGAAGSNKVDDGGESSSEPEFVSGSSGKGSDMGAGSGTGVSSSKSGHIKPLAFRKLLKDEIEKAKIDFDLSERGLNSGLSGGERKRSEILQMMMLKPKIAILDEIDSGLDIDALKLVAESVGRARDEFGTGVLLITHYQRLLNYVEPDLVHVMAGGRIVASGGPELAHKLEAEGYQKVIENYRQVA